MKYKIIQSLYILLAFSILSCHKEQIFDKETTTGNESLVDVFKPSTEINIKNGMLVFESIDDLHVVLTEMRNSTPKSIDLWEKEMGIKTPAGVFNDVINAEDSISFYYENLSESEQAYWRNQPQVHSNVYSEALKNGLIQIVPDGEGGTYFQLNLADNSMAGVVNLNGLVMVDRQIFQYTAAAIKIIKDGDHEKVVLLNDFEDDFEDDTYILFDYTTTPDQSEQRNVSPGYNWTQANNWQSTGNKTRVKVWVDGHSKGVVTYGDYCASTVNVHYVLRAEAQRKNFWGNWVYSNNYWPSLAFYAHWSYVFRLYEGTSCGVYHYEMNYVPPSGNHQAPCNYQAPAFNNAFIQLHPHGTWSAGQQKYRTAFKTQNAHVNAVTDNRSFTYNWHLW